MKWLTAVIHGKLADTDLRRLPPTLFPHRFVVPPPSATGTLELTSGDGERDGDTHRIERVYLDSEQAYGFAKDYNGISPVEPVQVEEWQTGASPAAYDGPYWRAEWWARVPISKRRGALPHTDEGDPV